MEERRCCCCRCCSSCCLFTLLRLTGWASAVAQAAPRRIKALYPDISRGQLDSWTCFWVGCWWRRWLLFVLDLFLHLVWFAWSKLSCKVTQRQSISKRRRRPYHESELRQLLDEIKSLRYLMSCGIFLSKSPLISTEVHCCYLGTMNRAQYQGIISVIILTFFVKVLQYVKIVM